MNPFPLYVLAVSGLVAYRAFALFDWQVFLGLPVLLILGAAYLTKSA